eukprot:407484_1
MVINVLYLAKVVLPMVDANMLLSVQKQMVNYLLLRKATIHFEIRSFCPSGNGTCSINVSGDSDNMMTDLTINAVNGLRDMSLSCNSSSATHCYSVLNPVSMACTADHGVRCHIALQSDSINDWQCIDNNITSLCDDSTTNGHYGSWILCKSSMECSNIRCNDDQDCLVQCGYEACYGANIYGPSNANLVVECTSGSSCYSANIYSPSNGNSVVKCSSTRS